MVDDDPFWTTALTYYGQGDDGKEWIAGHGALDQTISSLDPEVWNLSVERNARAVFKVKQNLGTHVDIPIRETRGEGVFDSIGGELWEAALLLCVQIIDEIHKGNTFILEGSALELGSGVGLGGFFLLRLKVSMLCDVGEFCLTDFDHHVLKNLASSLHEMQESELFCVPETADTKEVRAFVHKLDWFNINDSSLRDDLCHRFDYVFGSALVYNHDMALALVEICERILCAEPGARCKEIMIIQIKDRPGFDKFVNLLKDKKDTILVDMEVVDESVYNHALSIASDSLDPPVEAIGAGILRRKIISIPLKMNQGSRTLNNSGLIKTERDAFVRLRISAEGNCAVIVSIIDTGKLFNFSSLFHLQ